MMIPHYRAADNSMEWRDYIEISWNTKTKHKKFPSDMIELSNTLNPRQKIYITEGGINYDDANPPEGINIFKNSQTDELVAWMKDKHYLCILQIKSGFETERILKRQAPKVRTK